MPMPMPILAPELRSEEPVAIGLEEVEVVGVGALLVLPEVRGLSVGELLPVVPAVDVGVSAPSAGETSGSAGPLPRREYRG